ncbi:ABC transporter ATP-binding protein [Atopobiaceae bacterium 24-176]
MDKTVSPPGHTVSVQNLVKRYGSFVAVDHLSLAIAPGEVFGLLGPNGSGKTTTIDCILQLLSYDKGQIDLIGQPMTPTSYGLKRRVGVVPQNIAVFDELSVRESIDFFCGLYVADRAERARCVDDAVKFCGLEEFVKWRPRKLSGGLLRRLNIACGIAHRPDLAFFDEPTVAVDAQSRAQILSGIQSMNKAGTTVVYTSHYMEEVEQICSRVAILDHGRVIAQGTVDELKAQVKIGETVSVELLDLPAGLIERVEALPQCRKASYACGCLQVSCANGPHNLLDVLGAVRDCRGTPGRVWSEPPTLNDVFLELTGRKLRD